MDEEHPGEAQPYGKHLSPEIPALAVCPTVFPTCETALMSAELEKRIQQLCSQVMATQSDEELNRLCVELRIALDDHIRHLRQQVDQYRNSLNQALKKGDPGDVG